LTIQSYILCVPDSSHFSADLSQVNARPKMQQLDPHRSKITINYRSKMIYTNVDFRFRYGVDMGYSATTSSLLVCAKINRLLSAHDRHINSRLDDHLTRCLEQLAFPNHDSRTLNQVRQLINNIGHILKEHQLDRCPHFFSYFN
jgi:hypothetical protein